MNQPEPTQEGKELGKLRRRRLEGTLADRSSRATAASLHLPPPRASSLASQPVGFPKRAAAKTAAAAPPADTRIVLDAVEWRHAVRRRRLRMFLAVLLVSILAAGFAFAAGYQWKVAPLFSAVTAKTLAPEPEALRYLDEALRARNDGRLDDAMTALLAARKADSDLPGIDVAVGELAVERKDIGLLKRAADEALRRGESPSRAKVLLALERWASRGRRGQAAQAGEAARSLLAEAQVAEPSDGDACFFRGEIEHSLGNARIAHGFLLGGLNRQQPWHSADTIAAKMQLAAEEANVRRQLGRPLTDSEGRTIDVAQTPAGVAAVSLRRALLNASDPRPAIDALMASASARSRQEILRDGACADLPQNAISESLRSARESGIPGGNIAPPKRVDE